MKRYLSLQIFLGLSILLGGYLAFVVQSINDERINSHIESAGHSNYTYVVGVFDQIDRSIKNLSSAFTHYFDLPPDQRARVLQKSLDKIEVAQVSSVLENIAVFQRQHISAQQTDEDQWLLLAYQGEDYSREDIYRDYARDYPAFFAKALEGKSFAMQVEASTGINYGFFTHPVVNENNDVTAVIVGATEFVKNGHMILDGYEKQLSTPLPNYYAQVTWSDGTCAAVWDYERKLELSCEEGAPFVTTDYNYGPLVEPFYGAYSTFYAGQHFVDEHMFLPVEYFVVIYGCLVLLLGFYLFRVQALAHAEQKLNQVLAQNLEDQVQLNQAKDEFMSNMSHELRTPLNGIYGTLQALQLKDGANNKLLAMGVRSAEALIDILSNILDLQKISSRQMSINKDWFLTKDLCDELSALFASSAALKDIKLNVEGEDDLPVQLFGDRARLSQVLTNLLSNAVKFTAEGAITINYFYNNENQTLKITVSDTGIGMKQETMSRLFQRFMQADSSSKKQFAGTGLGLAISKNLVELMGGEIAAKSVYGEGSQFIVNIPVKAKQNKLTIRDEVSSDFLKSNRRILLVDDDESNTMVGQDILSYKYDYVDTALSAYMAIELLQKSQYDFVITDISMPDMTGEELLQYILKYYPEIQVIALTGNVYEHQKQKYLQLGFKAVIEKPLNHKVLFDTFEQFESLSNNLSSSEQFGKSIH